MPRSYIYFNGFLTDDEECPMPAQFVASGNFRDYRSS